MSRSRQPRINHSQDADEEKRLWTQIRADAKKIDGLIAKSAAIGLEIVEIERLQAALVDADKPSDAASDDKLEQLYRENIRINESIQHMIEGESGDTNFLDAIHILSALRQSADDQLPLSAGPRSASTNGSAKSRTASAMARRKGTTISVSTTADDTLGEDSASVASPRVAGGRLSAVPAGREKSHRGSSAAPSMREASVKIEDGAESIASSNDGVAPSSKPASEAGVSSSSGPIALHVHPSLGAASDGQGTPTTPSTAALVAANRLSLVRGAEVFYRNKGRAQEGEGILCRVTSVIGEGKQRRYEIQDADPDPAGGEPPSPYRASVSHLVAIPTSNVGLPDLPKGRNVLAQYPDTTTFYKAEVSTPWRAKDLVTGDKGSSVRLRFEGEMEEAKETEVERRFVVNDLK